MSIHYPAGVKAPKAKTAEKKEKKPYKMKVAPGNRGMAFEDDINKTNEYYKSKGLALISKRPTPINIVKVDYSKGAKITEAYFETQSTTDYNGIYKARYIDFEAKSTHSSTSFPFSNIPLQQIEHLEGVLAHGGIAFFLIEIVMKSEVYLLPASYVIYCYRHSERKSIPYEDIASNGRLVTQGYMPRIDYLPLVDELFIKQQ